MDSPFDAEELNTLAKHLVNNNAVLEVKVSDAFRYTEPAFLDDWHEVTKLSDRTVIISHVPGTNDFLRYMDISEDDVVCQDALEDPVPPALLSPLRQTLEELCSTVQSDEHSSVQEDLFQNGSRLLPFVAVALTSAFASHEFYHRLLLGCKDLVTVTAFTGDIDDLATRPLPGGTYTSFLNLLAHHNPYIVQRKRAGSPYRALVNILLAVAWDNRSWQPGLAILPIKSSGHFFRALLPQIR